MMKLSSNKEMVSMVHIANAEAHDHHAYMHDRNVPYIHRARTRSYYWKLLNDACVSHGKSFKGASVLEVGCGTGTFTDLVLLNGALKFYGIDVSPKMIEVARSKTEDPRAIYEVTALEFFAEKHKNEFDVIFSASFLHHLVDIEGGIKIIKSMLKPNGVYVGLHELITPRQITLVERVDRDLQYLFGYSGAIYTPLHTRIEKFFKNIILSVSLRVSFLNMLLNKYMSLKRYFRNKFKKYYIQENDAPDRNSRKINYVDYQLNEEFSLTQKAGHLGEVIPYSYLGFVELLKVSKPLNHEMLIVVNDLR